MDSPRAETTLDLNPALGLSAPSVSAERRREQVELAAMLGPTIDSTAGAQSTTIGYATGATFIFLGVPNTAPSVRAVLPSPSPRAREYAARLAWLRQTDVRRIADIWEREAGLHSNLKLAFRHPAYTVLSQLAEDAIAVAVERLRGHCRPLWISFLGSMVQNAPVRDTGGRVDDAATAWLDWARVTGYGATAKADVVVG